LIDATGALIKVAVAAVAAASSLVCFWFKLVF
jgi:hypothetical protein